MTGVGEEVDLVAASVFVSNATVRMQMDRAGRLPVFETRNAVNGIRALRRINIRGDLLLDAGIHGVVHKVEVEGGGVGAGLVISFDTPYAVKWSWVGRYT